MPALPPPTLAPQPSSGLYTCPYCRLQGDAAGDSCPHCGAPIDIRAKVSDSGWEAQPAIRDMARIQFGQSTCQISGAYVPAAEIRLGAGDSIYFSHHVMLWCDTQVQMGNQPMQGGWSRMMAGMPLIMLEAHGPGTLALSENHPGETIAVPLMPGRTIDVREHRFVMATGNIGYTWFSTGVYYRTRSGDETETHYPAGMYMDRFGAQNQPGLLLIHSPGNVFVRDLAAGETTVLHPGALVWKDSSVNMSLHIERPAGNSFSRYWNPSTPWLRLSGPGRIAMASVFPHMEGTGRIISNSGATSTDWNIIGIPRPQPQAPRPAGYGQPGGAQPGVQAAPGAMSMGGAVPASMGAPMPPGAPPDADPLVSALGPVLGAFAASQGFHPEQAAAGAAIFRFAHDSGIRIAVEVAPPGIPGLSTPGAPVTGIGEAAYWRQEANAWALEVRKSHRAVNVHVTGPMSPQDQFGWARAFAATAVGCM